VFELSHGRFMPYPPQGGVSARRANSLAAWPLNEDVSFASVRAKICASSFAAGIARSRCWRCRCWCWWCWSSPLDAARLRSFDTAAGALWVAMIFSGVVGATRALSAERENGAIHGLLLSPLEAPTLYAAKTAAAFIFMAVAEAGAVVMMVLFFNLEFDASLVRLIPVLMLGGASVSPRWRRCSPRHRAYARGGYVTSDSGGADVRLPALIAGVKASTAALAGRAARFDGEWLRIMVAFDVLFITAGYLLFEHVVGDD